MRALLLIPLLLTSCAAVSKDGAIMLGGKGAAKGGSGDGTWAMVWNGEKSFRDGAIAVTTLAAGYFGSVATQAQEATNQVVAKEATKTHAATQKTIQHATTTHAGAYNTAVGAEVPGVTAPAPPVAPVLGQ